MNEKLGEIIARLRKEKGMTQEDLARELNISYQAVSKWENGISSPDISNIKALAQLFGVSIDALFGLELLPDKTEKYLADADDAIEKAQSVFAAPEEKNTAEEEEHVNAFAEEYASKYADEQTVPWADDNTLRVVMYRGQKMLSYEEVKTSIFARKIQLDYHGEALNISSCCDVSCGIVSGNVYAEGNVNCDAVYGSVSAGGDVNCDGIGASVNAGGDVNCDDVGGDIRCGGYVDCGSVVGSVSAGGDVDCGSVGGNVTAAGDVDCGGVAGNVYKG